jgi:Mn-dependent DtxR family transcriptional regulator
MKEGNAMIIHESAEDYLEAILRLRESKGYVRSVDISLLLGVTKPSVSIAMKKLRESEYIHMDEDNLITLTEKGEAVARKVYDRHTTIMSFLMSIGVSEETAREDACKIEHDISQEAFEAIRNQLQKN